MCLGIYEYRREHVFRVDILHSQLQLNNYRYQNGVPDPEIRVTVTDTLGNVLYDTEESDVSRMGNHLIDRLCGRRHQLLRALQLVQVQICVQVRG